MKKSLALMGAVFFLATTVAHADDLGATPYLPADCDVPQDGPLGQIDDVIPAGETARTASFDIIMEYGPCIDGNIQTKAIIGEVCSVGVAEDAFLWPWQKEPVKVAHSIDATGIVTAHLDFDKLALFKHQSTASFDMAFAPRGMGEPYYLWRLDLTQNADQSISLDLVPAN